MVPSDEGGLFLLLPRVLLDVSSLGRAALLCSESALTSLALMSSAFVLKTLPLGVLLLLVSPATSGSR